MGANCSQLDTCCNVSKEKGLIDPDEFQVGTDQN